MCIIVQICANTDISWSAYKFAINRRSLPGNYTLCAVQYGRFLPRDAMQSAVHAVVVYLSVCVGVSVTLRYCVKTAKRRITQIMPHDSDIL